MPTNRSDYSKEYFDRVRATVLEGHTDCRRPSCCLEGLRNYRAQYMRDVRNHARATVREGHDDCQVGTCCAAGYRNRMTNWKRTPRGGTPARA